MPTPAQRHRERHQAMRAASQAASTAGVRHGAAASEYELLRAALGVDLRQLHELQSIERKIQLKRALLPRYMDWVDGVLEADTGASDDIVIHMLIWLIDIDCMLSAMRVARYVLKHQLPLPERFSRSAPTYICEEIAESALKRLGQEPPLELGDLRCMAAHLDEVAELVHDEDIFDEVRAKLEKAQGLASTAIAVLTDADADGPAGAQAAHQDRAIAHLDRALALNPKAGVKQVRDRLRKARADAAPAESETSP